MREQIVDRFGENSDNCIGKLTRVEASMVDGHNLDKVIL